jgi:hypothetical protein
MILLFGHGEFGASKPLSIDVQFNYPLGDFSRRMGAAFLEDAETNEIVLAHRGIVTLGHRVKKDKVFEAMAEDVVEANTSRRSQEYLLIASLSSNTLTDDISQFSRRLRSTVREMDLETAVIDESGESAADDDPIDDVEDSDTQIVRGGGVDKLRDYFEEFSGKRRSFKPKRVYPTSNHGKVVHALHQHFKELGVTTLKSRAVDLVSSQKKSVFLFEVKTCARSQSIYAAVGQLYVHEMAVREILQKRVIRVLVVPTLPMADLARGLQEELDIRIVTYSLSRNGKVTFEGLDTLQ